MPDEPKPNPVPEPFFAAAIVRLDALELRERKLAKEIADLRADLERGHE